MMGKLGEGALKEAYLLHTFRVLRESATILSELGKPFSSEVLTVIKPRFHVPLAFTTEKDLADKIAAVLKSKDIECNIVQRGTHYIIEVTATKAFDAISYFDKEPLNFLADQIEECRQKVLAQFEIRKSEVRNERYINNFLKHCGKRLENVLIAKEIVNLANGEKAILSTYCDGGNLNDLLLKPLSMKLKNKLAKDIVNGCVELHSLGIIHRDLKPDNILLTLDDKGEIAKASIADFNVATVLGGIPFEGRFPTAYGPPEKLTGKDPKAQFKFSFDIYQMGIILYHIYANKTMKELPFCSGDPDVVLKTRGSVHDEGSFPGFKAMPPKIKELVELMLDDDPAKRPPMIKVAEVLKDLE